MHIDLDDEFLNFILADIEIYDLEDLKSCCTA